MHNEIELLPDQPLLLPKLRTLLLQGNETLRSIPDNFFSEMKSLNVLVLSRTSISSLPISLTFLTNLRVLYLRSCHNLWNLSGIRALRSLEVLDLFHVTSVVEIPTELGELSNLRFLNLLVTECRIPFNEICRLSNLEKLDVRYGFEEWQPQGSEDTSSAAFAELACLPCLRMLFVHMKNERCFRQDLERGAFKQLKRLEISHNHQLFLSNREAVLPKGVFPKWVTMLARRAFLQENSSRIISSHSMVGRTAFQRLSTQYYR